MDIQASVSTASRVATFGGVVVVEKRNRKFLFGLTAGHPVISIQQAASGSMADFEKESGTDEEPDLDEELMLYIPDICNPNSIGDVEVYRNGDRLSAVESRETFTHDDDASPKIAADIGTIVVHSFSFADSRYGSNYYWALIDMTCEKLLPNSIKV
jgi:hypothetical protein